MSHNHDSRPTVFLDTPVLMQYLRGGSPESPLLSDRMLKRFRFAVNPAALSEILLAADAHQNAAKLEQIKESVQILPIDVADTAYLSNKLRTA